MSTRTIRKRVEKVQEKVCPEHRGGYSLEELSRLLWRQDREEFRRMAEGTPFRVFIEQFEREDAESKQWGA